LHFGAVCLSDFVNKGSDNDDDDDDGEWKLLVTRFVLVGPARVPCIAYMYETSVVLLILDDSV